MNKLYPHEYRLFSGANGVYSVKLTLYGSGEISLFYNSRRFILHNTPIDGHRELSFTASICDRHFHDCEYEKINTLNVSILGNAEITDAETSPCTAPTIYIAGDSTVTDQAAEYPYNPHSTYCGWGQMLPVFLKDGIAVSNHAQSGLSTLTYLGTNHGVVSSRIKSGDFFIIQFGHNDQKLAELDAFGGYTENLKKLISFARESGAFPILCTPINRIIFEPDGTLKPLLDDYANAVKTLGDAENVPVIDLHKRTTDFFTALGEPDSWAYFWSDGITKDYTHTNDIGGELVARYVAQGLRNIPSLSQFLRTELLIEPEPISGYNDTANVQNPINKVGLVNIPSDLDRDI